MSCFAMAWQELKALGDKVPPVITELVEGIQDASETAMEVRRRRAWKHRR